MYNPYLGVLAITVATSLFLLFMLFISIKLGPQNPTPTKQIPFECGADPVGSPREQRFNIRFYLIAMLFILFDIEVIFMYPWAVVVERLGVNALLQMFSFILVLAVGLIYVWRIGVLDWND